MLHINRTVLLSLTRLGHGNDTDLKCHCVERYPLDGLYARADDSSTPRDEGGFAPLNTQIENGDNNWSSQIVFDERL